MNPKTYDDNFFEYHLQGAINSAEVSIPIIREYIKPTSVIDIGCGIGAWLSVWKKQGANTIFGVDGNYIDASKLLIEKSEFTAFNLEKGFTIDRKYDLVTCLEVAEHLSENHAQLLIQSLCQLGDVILFSAAIPGQEGTMHVNEQYPAYWIHLFNEKGYVPVDCLRPLIWEEKRIEWWYRQNILFFVKKSSMENYPKLKAAYAKDGGKVLALIHPDLFDYKNKKLGYYESIFNSRKATFRYCLVSLFRTKKR